MMLRGEAAEKGASEIVTMDLLGGCGGGVVGDEVVDLEVKVPVGWERSLDLLSGKTYLTPHHQNKKDGHRDLNLPPPAAAASASAAVCTLDMVRSALERATAARTAAVSPATSSTSSASSSSSSSSGGKRPRSTPSGAAPPPAAPPAMRAAACPACLTYVLIAEADPRCPRCGARVPPLGRETGDAGGGKKPRIDLNAAAEETE